MILAIIGEELGLIGILALLVLYGMIGYAGLRTAKLARDSLLEAAGGRDHLADPLPGDAQLLRRARDDAADRRAAAVHLLRELEPDRAAGGDGPADGRGGHGGEAGGASASRTCGRSRAAASSVRGLRVPPCGTLSAGGSCQGGDRRGRDRRPRGPGARRGGRAARPRSSRWSSSAAIAPRPSSCRRPAIRCTGCGSAGIDRSNVLRAARALLLAAGATFRRAPAAEARRGGRRDGRRRLCGGAGGARRSLAAAADRPDRGGQPPGRHEPAARPARRARVPRLPGPGPRRRRATS